MANLTGLFKTEAVDAQDKDKLVDLFRNRAELKKEFAALRNEKYQLQDRIKEREAEAGRVDQQMDHLQNLLMDPEWVHNVVAFYQLRRLAAKCTNKLAKFAEKLKQQREKRAHGQLLAEWNDQRNEQAASLQSDVDDQRQQSRLLDGRLAAVRNKLAAMNSFVKLFRKSHLEKEMAQIGARAEALREKESELLRALQDVQDLDPPDPEGLDIQSKRTINFMILSFVQQLYLHFEEDRLSQMAKESIDKSVGAVQYGSKHDCDEIVERIEKRMDSMKSVSEFADVLQKRAKIIAQHARFRNDDDVVPASETVATVYAIDANGVIREKDVSLLGNNYFEVVNVMSR